MLYYRDKRIGPLIFSVCKLQIKFHSKRSWTFSNNFHTRRISLEDPILTFWVKISKGTLVKRWNFVFSGIPFYMQGRKLVPPMRKGFFMVSRRKCCTVLHRSSFCRKSRHHFQRCKVLVVKWTRPYTLQWLLLSWWKEISKLSLHKATNFQILTYSKERQWA